MSCPKWAAFSHAWYWSKGKEATYHNDILVASIRSCKQQPIYCILIVCIRVCLIPYIWFLIRILDFGKCNPYGTAKGGERFAKDLRKGGSWELLFCTTPIYIHIYIYYISWKHEIGISSGKSLRIWMILLAVGVQTMIVHEWLVDAMDLLAVGCRCPDMVSGEKNTYLHHLAPIILTYWYWSINLIDLTQSGTDI